MKEFNEMEFREGVKNRLSNFIDRSKYTHEQIAKMLDRSKGTVDKWKAGDAIPELPVLIKICLLFDTTPNYILLGLTDPPIEKIQKFETQLAGCEMDIQEQQERIKELKKMISFLENENETLKSQLSGGDIAVMRK